MYNVLVNISNYQERLQNLKYAEVLNVQEELEDLQLEVEIADNRVSCLHALIYPLSYDALVCNYTITCIVSYGKIISFTFKKILKNI